MRFGQFDIIKVLEEKFVENLYLIPSQNGQEKWLQDRTKNTIDEMIQVSEESQGYVETYEEDAYIIIENDIKEFKDHWRMY